MTESIRDAAPARSPPSSGVEVGRADAALERDADRAVERATGLSAGLRVARSRSRGGKAPEVVLEVLRSPGGPLDPLTRAVFEPAFGAGLAGVRVHYDRTAAESARAVRAAAYTVGSHVVFGAGRYAPGTNTGRGLIAHELAHVLQRRAGLLQRQPDPAPTEEVVAPQTGALAIAADWEARLRAEFEAFGDEHFPERYVAGRTWKIFELVGLPDLRRKAATDPSDAVERAVTEAVAFAREQARSEASARMQIDPEEHYMLFPETLARWYEDEAEVLRRFIAFDEEPPNDDWKLELAKAGDRDGFLQRSEDYEHERYEASLLEEEETNVLGGVFPTLPFEEHKRFLAEEGRRLAREAGAAEYDAYLALAQDPHGTRMAVEAEQSAQALIEQSTSAVDALVAAEGFTARRRTELGADVLPPALVEAWLQAELALVALNPVIRMGTMAPTAQNKAADAVEAFLRGFRAQVAGFDFEQRQEFPFEEPVVTPGNPYVSSEVEYFVPKLRQARTPQDWAWPVNIYKQVVGGFDRYIADQLKAAGRAAEGAELIAASALSSELGALIDTKSDVEKVPAVFYPDAEELRNTGVPGMPDFSTSGVPLSFYIYREDDVWHLADLTNPEQVKVVNDAGGTAEGPGEGLFKKLNTALRFPLGHLYWKLPDGTPGDLAMTAELMSRPG